VIDHGKVFVSETFLSACRTLGVSVQPARPYTPTDKAICERTFSSVNTLFCQYVAGYTGSDVTRRGRDVAAEAVWTLPQLQDLLDEWIVAGWQNRPHEGLRSPYLPGRELTPNEAYAVQVARAGYLPVPLGGRGLHRVAAGVLAGHQRLRHRDRPPHLRLPGPGPLPAHDVTGGSHARPVGSALRPL